MRQRHWTLPLLATGLGLATASQGADDLTGRVAGLDGPGLVLQYQDGITRPIEANGAFRFPGVPTDAAWAITIAAQPKGAHCTLSHRTPTSGDAPALEVECVPVHRIGGSVTGLAGRGLRLRDNGGESLEIAADGAFTFPGARPAGDAYEVSIETQPDQSVCAVSRGAGRMGIGDVRDVTVTCGTNASGFAYVLNTAAKSIATFRIDAANGMLTTAGDPIPAGRDPLSLTIDPLGRYAYVANYGSNDVLVYRIDRVTGALTAAEAPVAMGAYPISIALDPAGRYAYVANSGSNSLGIYRVDPGSGVLTNAGLPVATGAFPIFVTLDPAGRHAYVVNYGGAGSISFYDVDPATGALTAAGSVAAGAFPFSITLDPAGRFAYVANSGANTVSSYRVDAASGALIATGTPAKAGRDPQFITVDPGGRYAYVTNYSSDSVSVYRIDPATGALKPAGAPVAAGGIPISISMDPSGRFAYVATLNTGNNVSAYRIDAGSGRLSALRPRRGTDPGGWFSFSGR